MMKGPIWIAVADGGAARFFEQDKPGAPLRERSDLAMQAPESAPPRGPLARVHDSVGPARHNIEPRRYPRDAAEQEFLEAVAGAVNTAAEAKLFKSLVLCAPPRPLGMLRRSLSAAAKCALKLELSKDYVHATVDELTGRLREARLAD